jgi:hypothetical protein
MYITYAAHILLGGGPLTCSTVKNRSRQVFLRHRGFPLRRDPAKLSTHKHLEALLLRNRNGGEIYHRFSVSSTMRYGGDIVVLSSEEPKDIPNGQVDDARASVDRGHGLCVYAQDQYNRGKFSV